MKFEEYVKDHCGGIGAEFWSTWTNTYGAKLRIAIKSDYTGQKHRYSWAKEYCKGVVLFSGSWILFEYEEDSVLYAIKWL